MKRSKYRSLKSGIIISAMMFTFIITVLVVTFSYYLFNGFLKQSLVQSTKVSLYLSGETITKNLQPIISLSNWCETSTYLTEYLEMADNHELIKADYMTTSSAEAKEAYNQSKDDLRVQALSSWYRLREEYRNTSSNLYINRIIIGNDTKNHLHISSVSSFNVDNPVDIIRALPYFDQQLSQSAPTFTTLDISPINTHTNDFILPIIRPIYDPYSTNRVGWSYIDVSSTLLTEAFRNYSLPEDSRLYLTIDKNIYQLIDQRLVPITDTALISSLEDPTFDTLYKLTDSNGKNYDAVSIKTSLNSLSITQVLSQKQFKQQQQIYFTLLIIIAIIVIMLGIGLTYMLTHQINTPLNKLLAKMKLISKGDFSPDPTIEWSNELGDIGKGINDLATDVMELMDKRIEDEKEKSQLEYQILQSQINPHFLYNTLNSIKWMATIQNADGIAEMTTALSKLLRSVTKDAVQIHSLEEEIELLNHYIVIQKYRYGGTLTQEVNIDSNDLLKCQVPRFSLQPLVENAMFHGIEPTGLAGHISINIFENEKELLVIEIIDNGIGMTQDQINTILVEKQDNHQDFFKKIGIQNVNQRIKKEFGTNYGISISSAPGEGTKMTITIPKRFETVSNNPVQKGK